jgi:hypothetical protein
LPPVPPVVPTLSVKGDTSVVMSTTVIGRVPVIEVSDANVAVIVGCVLEIHAVWEAHPGAT